MTSTCQSLLALVNGDEIYVTFTAVDSDKELVWLFNEFFLAAFIALFTLVILNIFIAIFNQAYENQRKKVSFISKTTIESIGKPWVIVYLFSLYLTSKITPLHVIEMKYLCSINIFKKYFLISCFVPLNKTPHVTAVIGTKKLNIRHDILILLQCKIILIAIRVYHISNSRKEVRFMPELGMWALKWLCFCAEDLLTSFQYDFHLNVKYIFRSTKGSTVVICWSLQKAKKQDNVTSQPVPLVLVKF